MASENREKKPIVIERRRGKDRKKTPRLTKTYDVTIIPATVGIVAETEEPPKKRVAAYCRVSTDQEAQETSLEEQMAHFNTVIAEHPDWELAGIYTDEGISGTQVKHRVQFQQMIEDAKAKKIDLILTKSISRFARNVVDCLTNIRLLRNLRPPVSVYFDKERLDSLDEKAETYAISVKVPAILLEFRRMLSFENSEGGKITYTLNGMLYPEDQVIVYNIDEVKPAEEKKRRGRRKKSEIEAEQKAE